MHVAVGAHPGAVHRGGVERHRDVTFVIDRDAAAAAAEAAPEKKKTGVPLSGPHCAQPSRLPSGNPVAPESLGSAIPYSMTGIIDSLEMIIMSAVDAHTRASSSFSALMYPMCRSGSSRVFRANTS